MEIIKVRWMESEMKTENQCKTTSFLLSLKLLVKWDGNYYWTELTDNFLNAHQEQFVVSMQMEKKYEFWFDKAFLFSLSL